VKKEMNCNYVCKDETEEEIMKTAAVEHAMRDHDIR
jgi:predicted small metal-binding protein